MLSENKLKENIEKLTKAIKSPSTSPAMATKMKLQVDIFKAELATKNYAAPTNISRAKKLAARYKKMYGTNFVGIDIEKDADIPARVIGRRVSKGLKGNQFTDKANAKGHVYYEYRENRIDRKQPPKKPYALEDGGTLGAGSFAMGGQIEKNFSIAQMKEHLDNVFPDSFGFKVFPIKKGTTCEPDYDAAIVKGRVLKGLNDSDLDGKKLCFPKYKSNHSINFNVQQGGENTYFDFLISDITTNDYYSGTFGFKDDGDVESEYITRFIAFLLQSYGLPFQIKHEVYQNGGTLGAGSFAMGGEISVKVGDMVELQNGMKAKVVKLKDRYVVVKTIKPYGEDLMTVYKKDIVKMAGGGTVGAGSFADGGALDAILADTGSATTSVIGGTSFSSLDLTSHMDLTNPSFQDGGTLGAGSFAKGGAVTNKHSELIFISKDGIREVVAKFKRSGDAYVCAGKLTEISAPYGHRFTVNNDVRGKFADGGTLGAGSFGMGGVNSSSHRLNR